GAHWGVGISLFIEDLTSFPSQDEYLQAAAKYDYTAVCSRLRLEDFDVTILFEKLNPTAPCCLLESLIGEDNGRYSIIGLDSLMEIEVDSYTDASSVDPIQSFSKLHNAQPLNFPHFSGGLIGFWSYDLSLTYQNLPRKKDKAVIAPVQQFFLPGTVIVYDRHEKVLNVIRWIESKSVSTDSYASACAGIKAIMSIATTCQTSTLKRRSPKRERAELANNFIVNIEQKAFYEQVDKALEHIRVGDIFQVQISRRWKRESPAQPWNVYMAMRELNPSPYMFFLKGHQSLLIGASPEIQLKVAGQRVISRPIAGTRKVTGNAVKDEAQRRELLTDDKERAEHLMLVDLARNDLGRISQTGTVEVTELMKLEPYSHVVHLVSTVEGQIKPGLDALDAFKACFPAGTLTGAPKRKAMEIIEDIEQEPRGPYGGAVGHIDFNGNLDSCIIIRTILYHQGTYYLQSAAGIVADSVPAQEHLETLNKARAPMLAIIEAEEKYHDFND
ncbi:MAG: anthranilate synthase component I family protein, partial [Candidatus Saccharibacteria bacterium]